MAFDSFQDFLAMGGHAPYVWTAWALTAVLLVGSVLYARAERRQLLRELKRRARRERRAARETDVEEGA
ncbi:heme exporter protein CcmD [Halomonas salifodinae]|uniref:Heme exporter protein D n=1 Tax=Halomonas salifodinae TaxID=438745 RepID=A0ABW2EWH9_9GAMM